MVCREEVKSAQVLPLDFLQPTYTEDLHKPAKNITELSTKRYINYPFKLFERKIYQVRYLRSCQKPLIRQTEFYFMKFILARENAFVKCFNKDT